MSKIYCVEDDENIRELTTYALNSGGFEAEGFENASSFFERLETERPNLILLDIMLPDTDGMEILKKLKRNNLTADIPVIMLTAKSGELDKVKGLNEGADDYITKPFGVMELISRVNAVLRRTKRSDDIIYFQDIEINNSARTVKVAGEEVILTYKEFELLLYLVRNKGIVISRDKLMNEIWGFDYEGETRTVDVHVRTLRQKLKDEGTYIITVRNVGYKAGL